jgi:hypothetical protein
MYTAAIFAIVPFHILTSARSPLWRSLRRNLA